MPPPPPPFPTLLRPLQLLLLHHTSPLEEETCQHRANPSPIPNQRPQVGPSHRPSSPVSPHPRPPPLPLRQKTRPFVSLRLLSWWVPHLGLSELPVGEFLSKYPHVFDVFTHPVRKNACFKFRQKFVDLLGEEQKVTLGLEFENVARIQKILMMSVNGSIHLHALRLSKREFGLHENLCKSIILKYDNVFKMVDLEVVKLAENNGEDGNDDSERFIGVAEVEKWRESEYKEKWLSDFEVKYAFPMNFPTGFKKEPGFKEELRNWQRLSYLKPYEKKDIVRMQSGGGIKRYEKRAVAVIHELLCLTVDKMLDVQKLVHFRKDLGIEVNLRELVLKHQGIFYLSTKGNVQMVFLREAYSQGCLVEPNPLYEVRRKLLDLILLGHRCTQGLKTGEIDAEGRNVIHTDSERKVHDDRHDIAWNKAKREVSDEGHSVPCSEQPKEVKDGAFVIPILENLGLPGRESDDTQVVNLSEEASLCSMRKKIS